MKTQPPRPAQVRLDRLVSQAGGLSRSQARDAIRGGRVTLDGQPVRDPARHVRSDADLALGGRALRLAGALYLMMHKPCGLLSATRDARHATVLSLLPEGLAARVHLVGRLDKDTSGLLLLTDDGDWSHRISSPARHCAKTYLATLAEPLQPAAEACFAAGIQLRGEARLTRPALLERLSPTLARVTLGEGRYHQVRRMFAALGNRVVTLHRERIGGLSLDPTLAPGQWRELDDTERAAVVAQSGLD